MKSAILFIVLLAGAASALEDAKNRPVSKVVTLLKDMQKQLEKEADDDEEVFDKMACWCETNDKEKTRTIAEGEQRAVDLGAAIEEGIANSARLNQEVKGANAEVARNTKALDTATELRQRQLAEFNNEEKEMIQSITALKNAVLVIGKHHEAMIQEGVETEADTSALMNVYVTMKDELHKHAELLGEVVTPTQKRMINALVQEDQPANAGSYAPQSGQVFGVLKNMKESFEANLAASQREESDSAAAYVDLKSAKQDEITAGQTQVSDKSLQLGNTDEKLANDRQDLEDTENTLAADKNFLANLKEKCQSMDAEFAQRQKTRGEEIEAVSKAMAILSGDDAHDLFTKTFNPAFFQTSSTQVSERRSKTATLLAAAAKKVGSSQLAALALKVRLNPALGKVKDNIQAMITRLIEQKEEDIQKKDWCIDEMNENEHTTDLKDRDKEGLVAKIDDLTTTMDTLTAAINTLKAEIAEMQVQLKRAGEDREMANKEFQMTVSDQRATQKLLTEALNVLKGFYDKKAALLQKFKQDPAGPPAPPGFKSYENNAASGGVMGMIQQIINDAKAMEQEAIRGEEEAQGAYEDFVKDTNASINEKNLDITNKSETKAQAEADKSEADAALEGTLSELMMLANESADLHSSCDFLLKNFDISQAARDDEIEALKQSIAILSGAKMGFLQK